MAPFISPSDMDDGDMNADMKATVAVRGKSTHSTLQTHWIASVCSRKTRG